MRQSEIASVIERDLLREEPPPASHNIVECISCGHSFRYRGRNHELNGNFCSPRCQNWYDNGNPRHRDINLYRWRNGPEMKPGRHGFYIRCAGCHKAKSCDPARSPANAPTANARQTSPSWPKPESNPPQRNSAPPPHAPQSSPNGARAEKYPAPPGSAQRNARKEPPGPSGSQTTVLGAESMKKCP
jgi:hypothetical protein